MPTDIVALIPDERADRNQVARRSVRVLCPRESGHDAGDVRDARATPDHCNQRLLERASRPSREQDGFPDHQR